MRLTILNIAIRNSYPEARTPKSGDGGWLLRERGETLRRDIDDIGCSRVMALLYSDGRDGSSNGRRQPGSGNGIQRDRHCFFVGENHSLFSGNSEHQTALRSWAWPNLSKGSSSDDSTTAMSSLAHPIHNEIVFVRESKPEVTGTSGCLSGSRAETSV